MKKFELTTETKQFGDRTLFRIIALVSFAYVKAGDLGGWLEKEKNLSQEGNAWIYDSARVYGSAQVYDDAQVYGSAQVCDSAQVYGNARVYDSAQVCSNARVCDSARVYDNARVYGSVHASKNCINIQGRWNITISDNHIQIGCELHTIKQWFSYKNARISKMDISALDWWINNRKWLKALCKTRAL